MIVRLKVSLAWPDNRTVAELTRLEGKVVKGVETDHGRAVISAVLLASVPEIPGYGEAKRSEVSETFRLYRLLLGASRSEVG